MDKILHDPKDPKLWEVWYILYNGLCRILSINSIRKPEEGVLSIKIFQGSTLGPKPNRKGPKDPIIRYLGLG